LVRVQPGESRKGPQKGLSYRNESVGAGGVVAVLTRRIGVRTTALGFGEAVPVYKKILVAYDDPESGTLARAADLAEETKATLIVTNVVAPVERSEVKEADREARQRLDEAGSYLKRRGLSGELVSSVGPPAEAILRLAKERQVDLLVVGTRKKGFFERLVEGSVAQNVLRGASCDVLVVY
jgi:nucleotide-binding universal stress UspA family protein